jgi:hypothetical protein
MQMMSNLLHLRPGFKCLSSLAKIVNGRQHSTTSNMFSLYQLDQRRLKRGYTTKALVFHTAIWAIFNQAWLQGTTTTLKSTMLKAAFRQSTKMIGSLPT